MNSFVFWLQYPFFYLFVVANWHPWDLKLSFIEWGRKVSRRWNVFVLQSAVQSIIFFSFFFYFRPFYWEFFFLTFFFFLFAMHKHLFSKKIIAADSFMYVHGVFLLFLLFFTLLQLYFSNISVGFFWGVPIFSFTI